MGFSIHIPLVRGTLKIKTRSRLRTSERARDASVLKIGWVYFVWAKNLHVRRTAQETIEKSVYARKKRQDRLSTDDIDD